jgi:transcriptional regulator with XRE-family HTH domain
VITHQLGRQCCSNEFGQALCDEYNKNGLNLSLDTTGVYTDSASLMEDIAECTNISVGYYNEHRGTEMQNITYLKKLAEASVKVNWNNLPVKRKVGYNEELFAKHKDLINEIKKNVFGIDIKVVGKDDKIFISLDLEESDMSEIYDSLIRVQTIIAKHKITDDCFFEETYLKIELR